MKILLASSEVVPFAKTGGLADVCGALPVELAKLGHEVSVIMPAYRRVRHCGQEIADTGIRVEVPIGSHVVEGRYLRSHLPGSDVPVYLVEQARYFDRDELYREAGRDYKDNCERFVFFCRAVMESIRLFDLNIDLIHANDWQTGLLPAFQKIEYDNAPGYEQIATLLTIHNMAYQGQFWHWDMLLTGLDWKYFNWRQMEYYGDLNLLKSGIVFADSLNTVSPQYAAEIQQSPLGCGLEGVLSHRSNVLSGIINGVDYSVWNPASDPHLAATYTSSNWEQGKARCKAALQIELGLPDSPQVPLIGLVGRLADQKGFDLVAQVIKQWVLTTDAQWAILGTGESQYHTLFRELSAEYPSKVAAKLLFSDALAHRVEAGSDIFLMPSRYEPCGLNQLYSLKYGSVPVVHRTGGLADTISDASGENLANRRANGFVFDRYEMTALDLALDRACQAFLHEKPLWNQLVETGMTQDWSWAEKRTEVCRTVREHDRPRHPTLRLNDDETWSRASGSSWPAVANIALRISSPPQTNPGAMLAPFCAGHEDETTPTIASYRLDSARLSSPWQVRVVSNLYPAFVLGPSQPNNDTVLQSASVGQHEVIIESPTHRRHLTELSLAEVQLVFAAYRDRLRSIRAEGHFGYALVFKNSGRDAGMSREHLHSQLVALPSAPPVACQELSGAKRFWSRRHQCVFCFLQQETRRQESRFVIETESMMAFCPFASRVPYETWVLPKEHRSCFEDASDAALRDVAATVLETIRRLQTCLGQVAYNYLLHTNPFDMPRQDHYHWHIEILPRTGRLAGLEWGTGLLINTVPPEVAAERLRSVVRD